MIGLQSRGWEGRQVIISSGAQGRAPGSRGTFLQKSIPLQRDLDTASRYVRKALAGKALLYCPAGPTFIYTLVGGFPDENDLPYHLRTPEKP